MSNKGKLPNLSKLNNKKKKTGLPHLNDLQKNEQPSNNQKNNQNLSNKQDNNLDDIDTSYENNKDSFEHLNKNEVNYDDNKEEKELSQNDDDKTNNEVKSNDSSTHTINKTVHPTNKTDNSKNHNRHTEPGKFDNRFEPGTDTQNEEPHKYVDKKKHKILPFGGEKSKRTKHKDPKFRGRVNFDDRKDLLLSVKIIRVIAMGGIALVVGMGVYNTFFKHIPNQVEIQNIAASVSGNVGYPTQRGQALAEQFAQAYLTENNTTEGANLVNYLQTGKPANNSTGEATSNNSLLNIGKNTKQNIIIAPKTYNSVVASPNSATYYVTTMLSGLNGKNIDSNGNDTTHMVSLAINVLYDKKHDSLSVSKDSPALVPSPYINQDNTSGDNAKIGTGTPDTSSSLSKDISPTIKGFLQAFSNSSLNNHSEVNQFVQDNSDNSVYEGFAGKYNMFVDNTNDGYTIYPVSSDDNNSQWKVDVHTVIKDNNSKGENSVSYSGRYIITIIKNNGKYFITSMKPFTYLQNK